jgi:hypothetical protein
VIESTFLWRKNDPETTIEVGIHLTNIVQPEQGVVFIMYCPTCRAHYIRVSEHGQKPKDGDAWEIYGYCPEYPEHYDPKALTFNASKEINLDNYYWKGPFSAPKRK